MTFREMRNKVGWLWLRVHWLMAQVSYLLLGQAFISVKAYGAKGDGVTDDTAAIQRGLTAVAGTGISLWFPVGTYKTTTALQLSSNTEIWGSPGAVILGALPTTGGPNIAVFNAGNPNALDAGTLEATPTVGSNTINLNNPTGGVVIVPGQYVAVQHAGATFQAALYKITAVTSHATYYTCTLDRPILFTFASGDSYSLYTAPNSNIRIRGNGLRLTGTCVRYIELEFAWNCIIEDVTVDTAGGAGTDLMVSLDNYNYRSLIRRCSADGGGNAGTVGFAIESGEDSGMEDLTVKNCASFGLAIYDSIGCWVNDCSSQENQYGLIITADGNTVGCQEITVKGGSYTSNTADGVTIQSGSSYTTLVGVEADYNAVNGISLTSASAAAGTQIIGCKARGNTQQGFVQNSTMPVTIAGLDVSGSFTASGNGAAVFQGPARVTGLVCVDAVPEIRVYVNLAAGILAEFSQMHIDDNSGTPVNIFYINAGEVHIIDSTILVGHSCNSVNLAAATSKLKISRTRIAPSVSSSGETGFVSVAGSTLRLGDGVDADATSAPLSNVIGYCSKSIVGATNAAPIVANGVTPVNIAWPDLKSTDRVVLSLLTKGGTPAFPDITYTPGTQFTLTSFAADTSTYHYVVI